MSVQLLLPWKPGVRRRLDKVEMSLVCAFFGVDRTSFSYIEILDGHLTAMKAGKIETVTLTIGIAGEP